MEVGVKYYAMLRDATGRKTEEVELPEGSKVSDLLKRLTDLYGDAFRRHIYDGEGRLKLFLSYMLNGVNIHSLRGFDTELKDGDVLAMLPPVGGG